MRTEELIITDISYPNGSSVDSRVLQPVDLLHSFLVERMHLKEMAYMFGRNKKKTTPNWYLRQLVRRIYNQ